MTAFETGTYVEANMDAHIGEGTIGRVLGQADGILHVMTLRGLSQYSAAVKASDVHPVPEETLKKSRPSSPQWVQYQVLEYYSDGAR